MTEKQSTLTGIEKKYRYYQADGDYPKIIKGDINYCFAFPFDAQMLCEELNEMVETIETLKEENGRLRKENKRLYEDNIRVKQLITDFYNNERTAIGRSVIQQILEAL